MDLKLDDTLKSLIDLGKRSGYLTWDQVNAQIPPDTVEPERLDQILELLDQHGISIIEEDQAEDRTARLPAEAPDELVVRALSSLRVREAPLRLLTGLFNEARFSTHDLGPAERRQAIVALEQARDDLRSLIDASTTHPVG